MNGLLRTMRKLTVTYKAHDVVVVPFPFTDSSRGKKRPALILSSDEHFKINQSIMAMITSAKNSAWPLDVTITDLNKAGLSAASVVRMKLFTLDHRWIIRKAGSLSETDRRAVSQSVSKVLKEIHLVPVNAAHIGLKGSS